VGRADSSCIPMPREGIELAEIEGESVLYDPKHMTMLYLNESASVVWRLCDGRRTVASIVETLAEAFPEATNEVSLDIPEAIDLFAREGVLELGEA